MTNIQNSRYAGPVFVPQQQLPQADLTTGQPMVQPYSSAGSSGDSTSFSGMRTGSATGTMPTPLPANVAANVMSYLQQIASQFGINISFTPPTAQTAPPVSQYGPGVATPATDTTTGSAKTPAVAPTTDSSTTPAVSPTTGSTTTPAVAPTTDSSTTPAVSPTTGSTTTPAVAPTTGSTTTPAVETPPANITTQDAANYGGVIEWTAINSGKLDRTNPSNQAGDHNLSFDEVKYGGDPQLLANFSTVDADGNGKITKEELASAGLGISSASAANINAETSQQAAARTPATPPYSSATTPAATAPAYPSATTPAATTPADSSATTPAATTPADSSATTPAATTPTTPAKPVLDANGRPLLSNAIGATVVGIVPDGPNQGMLAYSPAGQDAGQTIQYARPLGAEQKGPKGEQKFLFPNNLTGYSGLDADKKQVIIFDDPAANTQDASVRNQQSVKNLGPLKDQDVSTLLSDQTVFDAVDQAAAGSTDGILSKADWTAIASNDSESLRATIPDAAKRNELRAVANLELGRMKEGDKMSDRYAVDRLKENSNAIKAATSDGSGDINFADLQAVADGQTTLSGVPDDKKEELRQAAAHVLYTGVAQSVSDSWSGNHLGDNKYDIAAGGAITDFAILDNINHSNDGNGNFGDGNWDAFESRLPG
jgi:hypothetical protein